MMDESEDYYDKSPSKEIVKESFDFPFERVPFRSTIVYKIESISEMMNGNIGQNQNHST